MRSSVRIEVLQRLLAAIDGEAAPEQPRTTRLDISRYTNPDELARERQHLFRSFPLIAAHETEIPTAGDYVTIDCAGVPLVALRDQEGQTRVFVNACRHRGARLLDDARGSCAKALTCPYHAWSYRLDGSLLHIPNDEVFATLDRDSMRLREVQHEVRHGFIWVQLASETPLDAAKALGAKLDDDFDAFDLAGHYVARVAVHERNANWKLVMDAFAEGYHLKSLHRKSLARFFLENTVLDDCAPHVRQVGARKSILDMREQPTSTWDFRAHTTAFYNLFPNVVLVFHPHWVSQLSMFPLAVDRVRVIHRMLAPAGSDEEKLVKSFEHIDGQVFQKEDLAISESIQSTLASGANDHVTLGALEEGMRLFHQARDAAINGAC